MGTKLDFNRLRGFSRIKFVVSSAVTLCDGNSDDRKRGGIQQTRVGKLEKYFLEKQPSTKLVIERKEHRQCDRGDYIWATEIIANKPFFTSTSLLACEISKYFDCPVMVGYGHDMRGRSDYVIPSHARIEAGDLVKGMELNGMLYYKEGAQKFLYHSNLCPRWEQCDRPKKNREISAYNAFQNKWG